MSVSYTEGLTDCYRAIGALDPRDLGQPDRIVLRKIATLAQSLADEDTGPKSDRKLATRAGYVAKSGQRHATSGSDFEGLVEQISKSECCSYEQACQRAAMLSPDLALDYQDSVRYGRISG